MVPISHAFAANKGSDGSFSACHFPGYFSDDSSSPRTPWRPLCSPSLAGREREGVRERVRERDGGLMWPYNSSQILRDVSCQSKPFVIVLWCKEPILAKTDRSYNSRPPGSYFSRCVCSFQNHTKPSSFLQVVWIICNLLHCSLRKMLYLEETLYCPMSIPPLLCRLCVWPKIAQFIQFQ